MTGLSAVNITIQIKQKDPRTGWKCIDISFVSLKIKQLICFTKKFFLLLHTKLKYHLLKRTVQQCLVQFLIDKLNTLSAGHKTE